MAFEKFGPRSVGCLRPRRDFWPNLVRARSYGSVMTFGLRSMWAGRGYWRENLLRDCRGHRRVLPVYAARIVSGFLLDRILRRSRWYGYELIFSNQ